MGNDSRPAPTVGTTVGFLALVLLLLLSGCAISPRYYLTAEQGGSLGCFKFSETSKYYEAHADIDRRGGADSTQLLDFALNRLNGIFTRRTGIYSHLFYQHWDTGIQCSEDKNNPGPRHVAISSFAIPPAAPAAAAKQEEEKKGTSILNLYKKPDDPPSGAESPGAAGKPKPPGTAKTPPKTAAASKTPQKKPSVAPSKPNPSTDQTPADKPQATTILPADIIRRSQIVISSYLYSNHPADRLDKVYAIITPLDPGVEFLSIDEVKVQIQDIDFGLLKSQSNVDFSAIPFASLLQQTLTVTPKFQQQLERKLQRRYSIQNVEIFPLRNVLLVSEDGGPAQADISGNKSVTVTVRIPAGRALCRYHTVYDLQRKETAVSGFERTYTCHIDRIPAVMGAVAVARAPSAGGSTVEEGDDAVTWIPFKSLHVFDVWTNPTSLYGIDFGDSAVTVNVNGKKQERLLFGSFAAALVFRGWLSEKVAAAGDAEKLKGAVLPWEFTKGASVSIGFERGKGKSSGERITTCLYQRPAKPENVKKLSDASIPSRAETEYCALDD